MGQCGITSSKTVLVFLNLIFWVSGADGRGRARGRRRGPGEASSEVLEGPGAAGAAVTSSAATGPCGGGLFSRSLSGRDGGG